jgi:hypothetical protein
LCITLALNQDPPFSGMSGAVGAAVMGCCLWCEVGCGASCDVLAVWVWVRVAVVVVVVVVG